MSGRLAGKLPPCVPYDPATPDDLAQTVNLLEATGHKILASVVDTRDGGRGGSIILISSAAGIKMQPFMVHVHHAVSSHLGRRARRHRRRGGLAGQRKSKNVTAAAISIDQGMTQY